MKTFLKTGGGEHSGNPDLCNIISGEFALCCSIPWRCVRSFRLCCVHGFNISRPSFALFGWHVQVCVAINVYPQKTQKHAMVKNFISPKIAWKLNSINWSQHITKLFRKVIRSIIRLMTFVSIPLLGIWWLWGLVFFQHLFTNKPFADVCGAVIIELESQNH